MKVCHVCKTECEDNAELCPVCGAMLHEAEPEPEEAKAELKDPVFLAATEDVVSAQILKDILTENGIMFSSDGEEDGEAMRVVFGGGFVSEDIYVSSADFDDAQRLYDEFRASEPEFDDEFDEDTLAEQSEEENPAD